MIIHYHTTMRGYHTLKKYILDLCQLPRLTFWDHKMKIPMPHMESRYKL